MQRARSDREEKRGKKPPPLDSKKRSLSVSIRLLTCSFHCWTHLSMKGTRLWAVNSLTKPFNLFTSSSESLFPYSGRLVVLWFESTLETRAWPLGCEAFVQRLERSAAADEREESGLELIGRRQQCNPYVFLMLSRRDRDLKREWIEREKQRVVESASKRQQAKKEN